MWIKPIFNIITRDHISELFYYNSSEYPNLLRYSKNGSTKTVEVTEDEQINLQNLSDGSGGFDSMNPREEQNTKYTFLIVTKDQNEKIDHKFCYWYGEPLGPKGTDFILETL